LKAIKQITVQHNPIVKPKNIPVTKFEDFEDRSELASGTEAFVGDGVGHGVGHGAAGSVKDTLKRAQECVLASSWLPIIC